MRDSEGISTRRLRARRLIGSWRTLLGGLAALTFFVLAPAWALATPVDDSGGAYQILAGGEEGSIPPVQKNSSTTRPSSTARSRRAKEKSPRAC